jgi:uncharacterized membrane protein
MYIYVKNRKTNSFYSKLCQFIVITELSLLPSVNMNTKKLYFNKKREL